ncbi:MAG: aspartyl protease family protein [Hyphomonas sp.]
MAFGGAPVLPAEANEREVILFEINQLNHMIVPIELNGQAAAEGVIDTAATYPMIDRRTALAAGIPEPGDNAPQISVVGTLGVKEYSVVDIGAVKVGNVVLGSTRAAYNPTMKVEGAASNVLPLNLLGRDVVDFDFRNRKVFLYEGRPERIGGTASVTMKYVEENGLIFIPVRVNREKAFALLDTGSNVTYINPRLAEAARAKTNPEKTKILQGATGGYGALLEITTVRRCAIGGYEFKRADVLVSDPPLFELLGLAEEPAMVVGMDFLSEFRMQIDQSRKEITFTIPYRNMKGLGLKYASDRSDNLGIILGGSATRLKQN